ncbi:SH3 domain-containing protein [Reinekea sp.]|uniref:SH3 domain-containing protein n=1 Tax=Reinekea sp. TaxID=1970455 RepID=UPI002A7F3363|nr:SH3 domain-containing protein [Reinekea sp.]
MKAFRSVLIALCLCLPVVSWASSVYVHSIKARLMAEPNFGATIVVTLAKGDELELLEARQRWAKVRLKAQEGWISTLLIKEQPPLEVISVIGSEAISLEGEARLRASDVATAGATRGLTEGEALTDDKASDFDELLELEQQQISDEEVQEFSESIQ